jgi:hypothetical protein
MPVLAPPSRALDGGPQVPFCRTPPTTQLRSSASTAANTGEAQAQVMSRRGDLSETRGELGWIPPELATWDAR